MNKLLIAILLLASLNNLSYAQDSFDTYSASCDPISRREAADKADDSAKNITEQPLGVIANHRAAIAHLQADECVMAQEVTRLKGQINTIQSRYKTF